MKKAVFFAAVMCVIGGPVSSFCDSLSISFASKQISGKYSPGRDIVVYVLNSAGVFVRTVRFWGSDKRDCATWNTLSSNNVVDAVSSATVSGPSADLSCVWNGKDANKKAVADGTYWLVFEGTADDGDASAPRVKIRLVFDGTSKTLTAADSSLNSGSTYFTSVNVQVIKSGAATKRSAVQAGSPVVNLRVGTSMISLSGISSPRLKATLFSLDGVQVLSKELLLTDGLNLTLPVDGISSGNYLCRINSGTTSDFSRVSIK